MKSLHRTTLVSALAVLVPGLALSLPDIAQASTDINESRQVSPDGRIQVDNMAGSIKISSWDRPEVEIRGELGDRVDELEISETSGGLRIRVHNQDNQRRVDESHLRLQVPSGVSVELESISADMLVQGLDNSSIVASSVSGDIDITANTSHLEAESVSGDVTFSGQAPRVTVETVSGEIDVRGVSGELRVTTVSGDLLLQGGEISLGRFETVSGDLEVNLQVSDGGRLSADSMSGDVTILLPASQQAEFSAQSYSGEIRTDFGTVDSESGMPGRSLNHSVGNNGSMIRIESFSGDARLKKQ
ncbi:MAG TPA: DUF4097 family beta strand repeat-containing protein [Xanthomonadales bacterium]|nr:DUF4097 family beta strand repeat-containing protein [Xanthomonadales bacterium]